MSYQIKLSPKKRFGARHVERVRVELARAMNEARAQDGITQEQVARRLGVHKGVISRRLKGESNLTLRTVGEMAWALGREIKFSLVTPEKPHGTNLTHSGEKITTTAETSSRSTVSVARDNARVETEYSLSYEQ